MIPLKLTLPAEVRDKVFLARRSERAQAAEIEIPSITRFHQLEHYKLPMHAAFTPAWKHILQQCGFPTDCVVIDFESYFDEEYTMRGDNLSTIEYVKDPRFEVLGVAVTEIPGAAPFTDYRAATHWWNGVEDSTRIIRYLQDMYGPNLERATCIMQNARFDGSVLAYRYGILPPCIVDVLGLARHWNSRSKNDLATLAERYTLPAKGDTLEFKCKTNRTRYYRKKTRKKGPSRPLARPRMSPEDVVAISAYARGDNEREWELFTLLLPKLSTPAVELEAMNHTLGMFFKPLFTVDKERGEEIKGKMQARMLEIVAITGETPQAISGDKSFEALLIDALTAAGDDYRRYTKPTKKPNREFILAIAQDDPEREELEKHPDQRVRELLSARNALKSWPLHIARIDRILGQAAANQGLLPVPLRYCGAHTRRWSGDEKINLQNLGKRAVDNLVKAIRSILIAQPGQELVIVDSSAIEARVVAWLAGQTDVVDGWASGADLYCSFASSVLGWTVRKPRKTGIKSIEDRHLWARNAVGKVGVLGCGYGMGPAKAVEYADGQIDLPTAEKLVKEYRRQNGKIVQYWRDLERSFIYTFKYQKPCQLRNITFYSTPDCNVIIRLPGGGELKYHEVRVRKEAGDWAESVSVYNSLEHKWVHIWGGHLAENVTQAVSRDILWAAVAECERRGIRVPLHVHDEIVASVPVGTGDAICKDIEEILKIRPPWALDLPLGAEGKVATRYGEVNDL